LPSRRPAEPKRESLLLRIDAARHQTFELLKRLGLARLQRARQDAKRGTSGNKPSTILPDFFLAGLAVVFFLLTRLLVFAFLLHALSFLRFVVFFFFLVLVVIA
jgi:hypothetical protein